MRIEGARLVVNASTSTASPELALLMPVLPIYTLAREAQGSFSRDWGLRREYGRGHFFPGCLGGSFPRRLALLL